MPHIRTNDADLLGAARALRKAAAVKPVAFVKLGLTMRFLDKLDAAIDALQDTIVARDGELLER